VSLSVELDARTVRLSLVYATLQYELSIRNTGSQETPPVQVRADLASAHAALTTQEQLAPAPSQLELRHQIPALAPGEATKVTGEVRLALQDVRTVVKGAARFFVPLVRLCLLTPAGSGIRRVYTVGPIGEGTLSPIRLDAGPRNLRELGAREIEGARVFTLDPVEAQG